MKGAPSITASQPIACRPDQLLSIACALTDRIWRLGSRTGRDSHAPGRGTSASRLRPNAARPSCGAPPPCWPNDLMSASSRCTCRSRTGYIHGRARTVPRPSDKRTEGLAHPGSHQHGCPPPTTSPTLEAEAVHVLREVAAEFERPVLLFSGGKD